MLPWASRASRGAEKDPAGDDVAIPKIGNLVATVRAFEDVLATHDEAKAFSRESGRSS